jgi:uncharacterized membrane protein
MKKCLMILPFFLHGPSVFACISCNKLVRDGIYNTLFYPNLFAMLAAFAVLFIIVLALAKLATKRYTVRLANDPGLKEPAYAPLAAASAILGIGLGGFADGIVLHQILQWHEMLTNILPADTVVNKSINMFWDGIFHLFTWFTTMIGVWLLWRLLKKKNINRSGYLLSGGMLAGWGIFNIIEGIIDHHILGLHNVREIALNHDLWNYSFLTIGFLLVSIGLLLIRKGKKLW